MLRLLNLSNLSGAGAPGHIGGSVGRAIRGAAGRWRVPQPATWINPADGSNWVFVVNGKGASALRLAVDAAAVRRW